MRGQTFIRYENGVAYKEEIPDFSFDRFFAAFFVSPYNLFCFSMPASYLERRTLFFFFVWFHRLACALDFFFSYRVFAAAGGLSCTFFFVWKLCYEKSESNVLPKSSDAERHVSSVCGVSFATNSTMAANCAAHSCFHFVFCPNLTVSAKTTVL
jgi:hypothetical protein